MSKELIVQHTPGPWKAHSDMDGRHRGYAILSEAPEFTGDADWPYHPRIAKAECGWGSAPKEIAQANAKLMAAAPDLLAALEGVLRVADRKTDEFDAARAAIAKAKGVI